MNFLSDNGEKIFKALKTHCKSLKMMDADDYELRMLANAFDKYEKNALFCRDSGDTYEMATKTGSYPMIRPEYNVMKDSYEKILKHSGKFGLNPGDRDKIFKGLKEDKKKKGFDTDNMKIA